MMKIREIFILDTCRAFFTTFDLTVLTRPMNFGNATVSGRGLQ